MQINISPRLIKNSAQDKFYHSTSQYVLLHSGYGLGKSHILLHKMLKNSVLNKGHNGMIVCPIYDQMTQNLIPRFRELLTESNVPFNEKISEHKFILPWGNILFRSAQREDSITALNMGYIGVDEACLIKDSAFNKILARVRTKNSSCQICFVGTPDKGKSGWIYNNFIKNRKPGWEAIRGSTHENRYIDPGYIDRLKSVYSPSLFAAYINGEFVDMSGLSIYDCFSEEQNVFEEFRLKLPHGYLNLLRLDPHKEILLSCDFGTNPGAWVIAQQHQINGITYLVVLDEIFLLATNTYKMCAEFIERYGDYGFSVSVYGDMAGKSKISSAVKSDYEIIQNELTPHFKNIHMANTRKVNQGVLDRFNQVNSALRGSDKYKLILNKNHTTNLQEDFVNHRYVENRGGQRAQDKTRIVNGLTTGHIADALGYLITELGNPLATFKRETGWGMKSS